jgi:hypothetical protein
VVQIPPANERQFDIKRDGNFGAPSTAAGLSRKFGPNPVFQFPHSRANGGME